MSDFQSRISAERDRLMILSDGTCGLTDYDCYITEDMIDSCDCNTTCYGDGCNETHSCDCYQQEVSADCSYCDLNCDGANTCDSGDNSFDPDPCTSCNQSHTCGSEDDCNCNATGGSHHPDDCDTCNTCDGSAHSCVTCHNCDEYSVHCAECHVEICDCHTTTYDSCTCEGGCDTCDNDPYCKCDGNSYNRDCNTCDGRCYTQARDCTCDEQCYGEATDCTCYATCYEHVPCQTCNECDQYHPCTCDGRCYEESCAQCHQALYNKKW